MYNPNGIKTHVANGCSTFFNSNKPTFIDDPRSLSKIHLILLLNADKLFAKPLRIFVADLLVSNSHDSEIIPFFFGVAHFSLLSWKFKI